MEFNTEVKTIGLYGGHVMKPNGTFDLTLKFDYSELTNTIMLQQLLNNDMMVYVKLVDEAKPFKLGMLKIKNTTINGDGTSKLTLTGINDYAEVDNLNKLISTERFKIRCLAEIEEEDEQGGEE